MDRTVSWDGIYNARDMGGLRRNTGTTAFDAFYRAPRLECLTDEGWQHLYDAGVRTIVDLRNDGERTRRRTDPVLDLSRRPAVAIVHCPTEDQSDPEFMKMCGGYLDSPEYYEENLCRWPEKIAQVFRTMARAPQGAIVFHCAAGRDRTGMIAMMLLLLAEVEPEEILSDYELSVRAMNEYLSTAVNPREQPKSEADLHEGIAHRTAILRTLVERLDVERYLLDAGLAPEELKAVKSRLGSTA